ncbi:unnamed protein product [Lactuca virosa]|uniref:Uncharacterized protein n=1 Tax=Lactuca virosa TaxID=75947 RepID=A0AAU9P055_9ASTR|nr:unnamed protein product [Lactuca virosa]
MELPLSRCALSKKKKSSGARREKCIRAPGARNSSSSCRYLLCRQLLRASREIVEQFVNKIPSIDGENSERERG